EAVERAARNREIEVRDGRGAAERLRHTAQLDCGFRRRHGGLLAFYVRWVERSAPCAAAISVDVRASGTRNISPTYRAKTRKKPVKKAARTTSARTRPTSRSA